MYSRKPSNASLCAQDRRRREDDAPRISVACPDLIGLKLAVEDRSLAATPKYIRRIVIENAPALFILPCTDRYCRDGGHDITNDVMNALRERKTKFSGIHECCGTVGSTPCHRSIFFEAEADFHAKSNT